MKKQSTELRSLLRSQANADRICRLVVAAVFVFAAVPKIFAPVQFAETIAAYGLLPDILVMPSALLIPPFELILAVGMLYARPWALWGGLLLLALFSLVLGYAIYLGLDIDCGCFGPEDPEAHAFSGLRTALTRDLVLICLLVYSILCSRKNKT